MLGAIYMVNTFDPIYMMTQGGPGTATRTCPSTSTSARSSASTSARRRRWAWSSSIVTIIMATFALRLIFKSFTVKEEAA